MLGRMMNQLLTDVDPDAGKQERRRRQVQRMVRAGQCDMELMPEPKQTVLL